MKKYADNKRYVKPSTLKEGDAVFVKRDDSKKKIDTPYGPRPLIVVEKKDPWWLHKMTMVSQLHGTLRSLRLFLQQLRKTLLQKYAKMMSQAHLIPQMFQCSPKAHRREATLLWLIVNCIRTVLKDFVTVVFWNLELETLNLLKSC